jgi:hypothetical protein
MTNLVGCLGVAIYLGSYLALQLGFLRGQSYAYAGLNIAAASCVLISLSGALNLSSALIQGSWIAISVVGIARLAAGDLLTRFTEEERLVADQVVPGLAKHLARRLLDCGTWVDGREGDRLTVEAEPVAHLACLVSGSATASIGGRAVGRIGPGGLIGEIGALRDAPATATMTLEAPSRYFAIGAVRLRHLARRDSSLAAALETSLSDELRLKLIMANAGGIDA